MQQARMRGAARYLAALGACLFVALALTPATALAADHEHDGVTFAEWTSTTELPTAPGSYYLADDVMLTGTWSVPPGGVKLCLDGHVVEMSASSTDHQLVSVPGVSTLDLFDCGDNAGMLLGSSKYGCMDVFGEFTMRGGTITNTLSGVDVFAAGGGKGTFTMEGGLIQGVQGAAVIVGEGEYSGTFVMTGGAIAGNEERGGIVFNNGSLSMSGDPVIFNNTEGTKAKNVFLADGCIITVADKLVNTEKIGVTTAVKPTATAPVVLTSGYGATMGMASPWMRFASDDDAYVVGWNADKSEAVLAVKGTVSQDYSVTVSEAEHGTVTADKSAAAAGAKVTLSVAPDEGYELDELAVTSGEDDVEVKDNAFTMPEGDVVVTATFEAKQASGADGGKSEGAGSDSKDSADKDASGSSSAAADKAAGVSMRRLYNPYSYEHFYTAKEDERAGLVELGWVDEGEGWVAPEASDTPVFRLYNPYNGGDHHYTKSAEERDALVEAGWIAEGTGWYSADDAGTPVYREYNPFELVRNHNYTKDKAEHGGLVAIGWHDEGIAWYGV